MKFPIAALALAAGFVVSSAHAAQFIALHVRTAGDLADYCGVNPREPAADARINYCLGFAQGVVDLELQHTQNHKPFCFPSPAPRELATMTEFVGWVRSSPDRQSMRGTDGLLKFLGERFPCK